MVLYLITSTLGPTATTSCLPSLKWLLTHPSATSRSLLSGQRTSRSKANQNLSKRSLFTRSRSRVLRKMVCTTEPLRKSPLEALFKANAFFQNHRNGIHLTKSALTTTRKTTTKTTRRTAKTKNHPKRLAKMNPAARKRRRKRKRRQSTKELVRSERQKRSNPRRR